MEMLDKILKKIKRPRVQKKESETCPPNRFSDTRAFNNPVNTTFYYGLSQLFLLLLIIAGRFMVARAVIEAEIYFSALLWEAATLALIALTALFAALVYRYLSIFIYGAYAIVLIANMESIYALDWTLNLRLISFALDRHFLLAALQQPTFPIYYVIVLLNCFICARLSSSIRKPFVRWIISHLQRCLGSQKKTTLPSLQSCKGAVLIFLALAVISFGTILSAPSLRKTTWQQDGIAIRSVSLSLTGGNTPAPTFTRSDSEKAFRKESQPFQDNHKNNYEDYFTPRGVNLSSPLLMPQAAETRNVLLLILEGIPAVYLKQVQEHTGVTYPVIMPELSRIAEQGLIVPHTAAHNRQTIRGLYSIFIGDYPRLDLSTPKIYPYLAAEKEMRPPALAEQMHKLGYRTIYLQAADLAYMSKDLFMPGAGFAEVLGRDFFSYQYVPFSWGPDDKAFLEQAAEYIDTLDDKAQDEPWFLTLLTVGTHHPYGVPDDFAASYPNRKIASVAYLDKALGNFMDHLQKQGILEETAVFIVCDESHGVTNHLLGLYWGLAAILTPETLSVPKNGPADQTAPLINPGLYGLLDIPITVLDYLGADQKADLFAGYSMLREQPRLRTMHFGPFVAGPEKLLTTYLDKDSSPADHHQYAVYRPLSRGEISIYKPETGGVFADTYSEKTITPGQGKELWQLLTTGIERAALIPGVERPFTRETITAHHTTQHTSIVKTDDFEWKTSGKKQYPIIKNSTYTLSPGDRRLLTSAQYLQIPESALVRMELMAKVKSPPLGGHQTSDTGLASPGAGIETDKPAVSFVLQLLEQYQDLALPLPSLPQLAAGQLFSLRFSFSAEKELSRVWAYLRADSLLGSTELKLQVKYFTITIDKEHPAEQELQVERLITCGGLLPPVAHAGGAYQGHTYTNSLEALEANASCFDLFEIDFEWTKEGHLVTLHDWDVIFRRLFGFEPKGPLTLDELLALSADPDITIMDLEKISDFLNRHPEVRIVTDIKQNNIKGLERIAEAIPDHEYRIIPQIYHPKEFEQVIELGYQQIIWTLYRFGSNRDTAEVVRQAKTMQQTCLKESTGTLFSSPLFAVAMPKILAKEGTASALQREGIPVYAHTVNSCETYLQLIEMGVASIYTDSLDTAACRKAD